MRKQIIENAAYEVATQVRAVEDTIDAAFAEIAELQARIMRANSIAGVGFAAVHPTLEQLATAVTGLVASRGAILGCHAALAEAKAQVPGLRTVSIGDNECPPSGSVDLRIVA
jgi:hypothetical protein